MDVFCTISWTKEDIRQLLEENGKDCSDESVEAFLEQMDIRYFEESCVQDGWERLYWMIK